MDFKLVPVEDSDLADYKHDMQELFNLELQVGKRI